MSRVQKNWTEAEPYSFTCHFVLLRWSLENTGIHIAVGVMLCQALMKKERAVDIWSRWWMFEVCVFMKWEGVMSRAIALKMLSMNIEVHVSFSIMVSSGYIPNNRINGSYGSFIPFFFFWGISILLLFSHSVVSESLQPHGLQPTRFPCPSLSPEFAQTYVHWVSDATQISHPFHTLLHIGCINLFPPTVQDGSLFSTPLSAFIVCRFFVDGRSDRCEVIPLWFAFLQWRALLTIASAWKQSRCPSTDEWIKKLWYMHTMEYYSAIKRIHLSQF